MKVQIEIRIQISSTFSVLVSLLERNMYLCYLYGELCNLSIFDSQAVHVGHFVEIFSMRIVDRIRTILIKTETGTETDGLFRLTVVIQETIDSR